MFARRSLLVVSLTVAAPLSAQAPSTPTPRSAAPAWQIVPQPQSSLVYARDGSLIGEIGRESRTSVSIRTLPKYVGQAFVAVEDKRFYQHNGVDVVGVAAAIKDAVLGDARGASTTPRGRWSGTTRRIRSSRHTSTRSTSAMAGTESTPRRATISERVR